MKFLFCPRLQFSTYFQSQNWKKLVRAATRSETAIFKRSCADTMQSQVTQPLDDRDIMWIKHQLFFGLGAGLIAKMFLKDHPGFGCNHGALKLRIRRIHKDMCQRRNVQKNGTGKVDNEPGAPWTTKETECLKGLLSLDYLSWPQRAVLLNNECNSSRTGDGLRQHHLKMQKEIREKERQDFDEFIENMPLSEKERQDFDEFMDVIQNETAGAAVGDFDHLLVDVAPLPATTWNPYEKLC